MASNPYKEDELKSIEEMLLSSKSFKRDLINGKYGYNKAEQATKVTAKIYDIYESMSF